MLKVVGLGKLFLTPSWVKDGRYTHEKEISDIFTSRIGKLSDIFTSLLGKLSDIFTTLIKFPFMNSYI